MFTGTSGRLRQQGGRLRQQEENVKETGTNVTQGNISIPASHLSSGSAFPTVKVSGKFGSTTEDGHFTPLVLHPAIQVPLSYTNTFNGYTPTLPTEPDTEIPSTIINN